MTAIWDKKIPKTNIAIIFIISIYLIFAWALLVSAASSIINDNTVIELGTILGFVLIVLSSVILMFKNAKNRTTKFGVSILSILLFFIAFIALFFCFMMLAGSWVESPQ